MATFQVPSSLLWLVAAALNTELQNISVIADGSVGHQWYRVALSL